MDIKTAFLHAPMNRDVWVVPPREAAEPPTVLWKLRKAVYGLADSPRLFYEELAKLMRSLSRIEQLREDDSAWLLRGPDGSLQGMVVAHVDDLLFAGGPDIDTTVVAALQKRFKIGKFCERSFKFAGLTLTQERDYSVRVSMAEYITTQLQEIGVVGGPADRELTPREQTLYRGGVGALLWCGTQARPDAAYSASVSARANNAASPVG